MKFAPDQACPGTIAAPDTIGWDDGVRRGITLAPRFWRWPHDEAPPPRHALRVVGNTIGGVAIAADAERVDGLDSPPPEPAWLELVYGAKAFAKVGSARPHELVTGQVEPFNGVFKLPPDQLAVYGEGGGPSLTLADGVSHLLWAWNATRLRPSSKSAEVDLQSGKLQHLRARHVADRYRTRAAHNRYGVPGTDASKGMCLAGSPGARVWPYAMTLRTGMHASVTNPDNGSAEGVFGGVGNAKLYWCMFHSVENFSANVSLPGGSASCHAQEVASESFALGTESGDPGVVGCGAGFEPGASGQLSVDGKPESGSLVCPLVRPDEPDLRASLAFGPAATQDAAKSACLVKECKGPVPSAECMPEKLTLTSGTGGSYADPNLIAAQCQPKAWSCK